MPGVRNHPYETHFYCALCGGPFAQVFRTAVHPAHSSNANPDGGGGSSSICTATPPQGLSKQAPDPEDLDSSNEFNFVGKNAVIPEDVIVEKGMGYAARRRRQLRLRAQPRHVAGEGKAAVRQAYDGDLISVRQMKWTKNLRALIHNEAANTPANWQRYTEVGEQVFLTGRGLIRQSDNWADAYASVDDEDGGNPEYPIFSESDLLRNTYGFHVYQELGGTHVQSSISSIPFHDECWSLLDWAIEVTGDEKGIDGMNEDIDYDHMWGYLRSLVAISGRRQQADQTNAVLREGTTRKEIVTRLGEVNYREAQGSGEGWKWRHEDGCHWLAADPSMISVRDHPLKLLPNHDPLPMAPRAALVDPFSSLPPEVILEIWSYLSSSDIFSLKIASPDALNVELRPSYYRRFLKQEFKYLPTLAPEIGRHEEYIKRGIPSSIDWRGSFERLRRLIRTPRLPENASDEDYRREWDRIDIGLKNRNRIWKIVKPIAETLVETSTYAMRTLLGAPGDAAKQTSVVRGYVGARSGREGTVNTAYIGNRGRLPEWMEPEDEDEKEETVNIKAEKVRFWCDGPTGVFCGLEFSVHDEELGSDTRRFGREGSKHFDLSLRGRVIVGFAFCYDATDGVICGAQAIWLYESDSKSCVDFQFAKKIGQWDKLMRQIIVPTRYRKFVGLTGFLSSAGFIETVGILEETFVEEDDHFGARSARSAPPRTLPLTHEEASLWKDRIPPRSVYMHEREGAAIPDWRLRGAEWEVWERSSSENELGLRSKFPSSSRLESIVGYYDQHFLRGLEFMYVDRNRRRTSCLLGVREGGKEGVFAVDEKEPIIASVISFGDEGVYGILFLTKTGRKSQVFGPRFRGTHKVFAPQPDLSNPAGQCGNEHRENIHTNIVGVHGIYDYEDKRFLQLGLAFLEPAEGGSCVGSIFTQPLPCSIPFDAKDESFESLGVWEDTPPNKHWVIGSSPSDIAIDSSCRVRRRKPFNDFSGWASLKSVSRIIIYGEMKGIRFSYAGDEPDIFFGDVDDESDTVVQEINQRSGEEIVGVAVLENRSSSYDDDDEGEDSTINFPVPMERIFFITNFGEAEISSPVKCRTQFSEYIVAVKFDFNHDQLISWAPIFTTTPKRSLERKEQRSREQRMQISCEQRELIRLIRFPWRASDRNIIEDFYISETAYVVSTVFDESSETGHVDAVKAYVTREGRFCGFIFRRRGKWPKGVFGERSAFETTFELWEGERFDSIFVPEVDGCRSSSALALSTNRGRTTPWFGIIQSGATALHLTPPPGHISVGLYGAQFKKPSLYERIQWNLLGLLYRPRESTSVCVAYSGTRQNPSEPEYHTEDPATHLRWLNGSPFQTRGLVFTPLLQGHRNQPSRERYRGQAPESVGRAFSVFQPENLLQIRVWCSQGICSIRLHGTDAMGVITVGDWPADAEGVNLSSERKMLINGPDGERISRIKVAFRKLGSDEERIVGLSFHTTFGREKTIIGSMGTVPFDCFNKSVAALLCPDDHEIVGLHGIFGVFDIHDLGLVVRKATPPLCSPCTAQTALQMQMQMQMQMQKQKGWCCQMAAAVAR
ncbi:hypothetical protein BZA05DRAFT_248172 [Tricharina praecox]|uniref:uncharacterized protein n=1 Tax=Tricharina praecox TaxID=43433 RepID=UPI00221F0792|nr:uncharacterized protein BZA05DRAFT_248172 [Tricharina praecox]KAI5854718.1 hypothetical protein BZA05DRAFT_248172 [Tricharina praecox]